MIRKAHTGDFNDTGHVQFLELGGGCLTVLQGGIFKIIP